MTATATAARLASAVRGGDVRAVDAVSRALARIDRLDLRVNSFTATCKERALAQAESIDALRTAGKPLPRLAGVPYAVKNLFDVRGLTTLSGSRVLARRPAATGDATIIRRLTAAGAVLVGALNMDEFAYGFTTENSHYGPTRNPHDLTRMSGGSSGGSAAAVAAGLVPFTLGSDTNGSIRVPSSLCGVFGLKPTFGRLSRAGSYPFATSLDHVGPFARSVEDLASTYDVMQGPDASDPVCSPRAAEPVSGLVTRGADGLRIVIAGDYFEANSSPDALRAVAKAAGTLGVRRTVEIPQAARARAAAFVITNCEAANLHLNHLRTRYADLEPLSRDRLLAGAFLPAAWYLQAQRFRRWFAAQMIELFRDVDVIVCAATPRGAPLIGEEFFDLNGTRQPSRPSLGLLTQPISFIGLPVVVAPIQNAAGNGMPIGVQLIAAPWREEACLRVAWTLEQAGVATAPVAKAFVA
jgi:1-carboxybiuret hydrolase